MVRFKAPQPKMAISVNGKLLRFGVDGTYLATDKEVIAKLDSLPNYVRVDGSKPAAKSTPKPMPKAEVKKETTDTVKKEIKKPLKAKKK